MSAGSSSSSTAADMAPPPKYDVFLSFRGMDTRDNFTSHLYAQLCRKNINAFIDYKLVRGHEISPELYKAIQESTIYVIIFSENYASSSWCLNELVKICECKKRYYDQRHVIPIFYKVEPATVRHQKKGSYADAFGKHEKRFPKEVIQKWKIALNQVAGISGWDSNATRPESKLVDGIVKDILTKLNRSFSSDHTQGMVRIEEHISQIQALLQLESMGDVRIIGIWGMGGIGKTTLAKALHKKLATQFSSTSLIENAQQEMERVGTSDLRKTYLSELLDEVFTSQPQVSDEMLKRARVLVIHDDVKDSSQVQELIGGRENFGPGSRIIVTSRDMQVLKNADADEIYEVKEMNFQDSLQLFSINAFKPNYHVQVDARLVEKVLKYAKGVPLALKVLGNLLYGRAEKVWKSQLEKLEKLPDPQIFNVLKLSYDGLDDEQKDIFLDIACFCAIRRVSYVEVVEMLDGCGFSVDIGMDVLKDRGLVSISEGYIEMHDLIREMGVEIVRQQCVNDPGKRSRLWKHEEIYHVLRKNKGTDAVQCIFLDICKIKKFQLQSEVFQSTPNLRMLYFHRNFFEGECLPNQILPALLESLPDGLKVLHWEEFPLRSLPLDFFPENLVKLYMHDSHLEQLWWGNKELPNLKSIDLSYSSSLIRISSLSKSLYIEEIILVGCVSLTSLPIDMCKLKLLRRLDLCGCLKLKKIPEIKETMENLVELNLHNCSRLEMIPSSIERLTKLCKLNIMHCQSLKTFPSSIFKLKLTELDLSGFSKLKTFPEILEPSESLAYINLKETAIKELPSSLDCLVGLQILCLDRCRDLESLPNSIGRLSSLRKLSLQDTGIVNLPESIAHLSTLESLDVSHCRKLTCIPQLPPFLKDLFALDCPSIRRVMPNSRFKHRLDSKEGTFEFHFSNNEKHDHQSAHSDILADARLRISEDACRFVFYCFPGWAVPDWFPYRCPGNSVTVDKYSLNWHNDNRLIGFAMCVVLRLENLNHRNYGNLSCKLTFEYDGWTHILPNDDQLNDSFYRSGHRMGHVMQDHTFLWKYNLMDSTRIDKGNFQTLNFSFGIGHFGGFGHPWVDFAPCFLVKECGILPLYAKEKDDIGGLVDSISISRASNNDFAERSGGRRHCLRWNWFE